MCEKNSQPKISHLLSSSLSSDDDDVSDDTHHDVNGHDHIIISQKLINI
jgi:hypothetical protein